MLGNPTCIPQAKVKWITVTTKDDKELTKHLIQKYEMYKKVYLDPKDLTSNTKCNK
ncbi:MAG: hypothetical protein Tsb0021_10910 [Chlamydiales bacterium]